MDGGLDEALADGRAALEVLVHARRARWVAAARRLVGDEAEDVVQETLAAVWRRPDCCPPQQLAAYVHRAVERNALKRRIRRRRHEPLDAVAEPAAREEPSDRGAPELDPGQLESALRGLPPTQQAALRMRYYLGMSFRQIGQSLSISTNTAASRCRYGLQALRRAFGRRP